MKVYLSALFVFLFLLISCKDNSKADTENNLRSQVHSDSVFTLLNEKWDFKIPALSDNLQIEIEEWKQWRDFKEEIDLKPVASIGAFQKKAENLSSLSSFLQNNIPETLNKPEIRARITVLNNTFNSIQMYLEVKPIPYKEIDALLPKINKHLNSLVEKMEELNVKKSIPREKEEKEMLRALDTIRRANPIFRNTTR